MSTLPATDPLLTAEQVAQRLGSTRAQVLRLRRLDPCPIPAINISTGARPSYRWRPSVIDTFLRNRRAGK